MKQNPAELMSRGESVKGAIPWGPQCWNALWFAFHHAYFIKTLKAKNLRLQRFGECLWNPTEPRLSGNESTLCKSQKKGSEMRIQFDPRTTYGDQKRPKTSEVWCLHLMGLPVLKHGLLLFVGLEQILTFSHRWLRRGRSKNIRPGSTSKLAYRVSATPGNMLVLFVYID